LTEQLTLDKLQLNKITPTRPLLFIGDCIEIMKSFPVESVDLIIDDVGYDDLEKDRAIGTTTRLTEKSGTKWYKLTSYYDTIPIYSDILRKNRHIYFWRPAINRGSLQNWNTLLDTAGIMTKNNFRVRKVIPVIKNYRGMGYSYNAQHEMLLYAIKGNGRQLNNLNYPDYFNVKWKNPQSSSKIHTSEKPLEAYKIMMENSSNKGEMILEPFAGSFQSALCNIKYNMGRKIIGIEIDEENAKKTAEYFEKITKKKLILHRL
jgi:site-specific DNA-methyltransferase (adenine-specific)